VHIAVWHWFIRTCSAPKRKLAKPILILRRAQDFLWILTYWVSSSSHRCFEHRRRKQKGSVVKINVAEESKSELYFAFSWPLLSTLRIILFIITYFSCLFIALLCINKTHYLSTDLYIQKVKKESDAHFVCKPTAIYQISLVCRVLPVLLVSSPHSPQTSIRNIISTHLSN
jgi:hypothetical protein